MSLASVPFSLYLLIDSMCFLYWMILRWAFARAILVASIFSIKGRASSSYAETEWSSTLIASSLTRWGIYSFSATRTKASRNSMNVILRCLLLSISSTWVIIERLYSLAIYFWPKASLIKLASTIMSLNSPRDMNLGWPGVAYLPLYFLYIYFRPLIDCFKARSMSSFHRIFLRHRCEL